MSIWTSVKAKWDELLGRAEQLYGESHGDAAAEAHGEAMRLEGESLEGHEGSDAAGRPRPDETRPSA